MQTIYTFKEEHIADLHGLYQKEWWTDTRTLEETNQCMDGSQVCIGLVDDSDRLVGFVRVLTDYVFKALLFDVIVDKTYRGTGLGERLMSLVLEHPALSQVKSFELYCLPEMFPFYQKLGFSDDVGGIKLMKMSR